MNFPSREREYALCINAFVRFHLIMVLHTHLDLITRVLISLAARTTELNGNYLQLENIIISTFVLHGIRTREQFNLFIVYIAIYKVLVVIYTYSFVEFDCKKERY